MKYSIFYSILKIRTNHWLTLKWNIKVLEYIFWKLNENFYPPHTMPYSKSRG